MGRGAAATERLRIAPFVSDQTSAPVGHESQCIADRYFGGLLDRSSALRPVLPAILQMLSLRHLFGLPYVMKHLMPCYSAPCQ